MKTKQILIGINLVAAFLYPNLGLAQTANEYNLYCTATATSCNCELPINEVPLPINDSVLRSNSAFIVDEANASLKLNYKLPSNSYSAYLQIIDFTGRIIKSFPLNTLSQNQNEFYINDLLSGDYNCTLTIDEQKRNIGGFTINE